MEIQGNSISNGVNKATTDARAVDSPFVLDLSKNNSDIKAGDKAPGAAGLVLSNPGRPAYHMGGNISSGRTGFFSFKKIVACFVFLVLVASSIFGLSFYKKINDLKKKVLTVNAMSESDLADMEKMLEIIRYLPAGNETKKLKDLAGDFESFKDILGFNRSKKYLLVFQNPSEIRATGGFIGSVGILDIEAAKIKNIRLEDVYNLDGQLKEYNEPPWPIKKISAAWSLHDSNWFFDFPDSARKISWFYEKTGGTTPDGVIAMNPEVVKRILKITGSVKIEKYGVVVDSRNFVELTQQQVENEYDKTINQPKLFLADFMKEFKGAIERLPMDKKIAVVKSLITGLDQKDIQVMLKNENSQNFIVSHNWDGKISETERDYLAIVHSSINGFKSDAMVSEKQNLVSEIAADGSVVETLTITRAHNGLPGGDDWYNRVNSDYLRVFIPKGSELISVSGVTNEKPFLKDPIADYSKYVKDDTLSGIEQSRQRDEKNGIDIFEESGKTVFGAWVYVSPGEKVTVTYKYRLPFKVVFDTKTKTGSYGLLYQKQSGSRAQALSQKILFPAQWQVIGNYSEDFIIGNGRIDRILNIESDKFAPVLFLNKP